MVVESQIDSVIMFGFSDAVYEDRPEMIAYAQAFRDNSTKFAKVGGSACGFVCWGGVCGTDGFDSGLTSMFAC